MKPGESINIKAVVLRVDGTRVDAQTANGELIQTHISNVESIQNKAQKLPAHKAILNAPENKSQK